MLAEPFEQSGDLCVILDVKRKEQLAAEVCRHLGDTLLEALVLKGEGQFRAFAVHGLGDAVRDRTVAEQSSDEDSLAG